MYHYQCYVTDPWWQCEDLVTVEKSVYIPWNPDNQTITISTNSEAGSKEMVHVVFYKDGRYAGNVYIGFKTEIVYHLGSCSSNFTSFSEGLPTETEKTWTITYNYTEQRLVFHCNGVQVADVLLSSVCASSWEYYWGRKPTQMKFHSQDGINCVL